ncbi:MAG: porin family protein [Bacteroidota bacterium]
MRKKVIIIPLLLLTLIFSTSKMAAQNTSVGFKGGPALTGISNLEGASGKLGGRVGGFITYSVSRSFGIGGEVNLVRKGFQAGNGDHIHLDYVEVPLLAQFFFGRGGFRPKIIVGPYGAYLLQATADGEALDAYQSQDYGAVLGAGFHQRVGGRKWLYFDVRYGYGIAEVQERMDYANRDISVSVGLSFPLDNWMDL